MKAVKILFAVACFANSLFGQKTTHNGEFSLVGKILGQDTGRLVLIYENKEDKYIRDTTFIMNGSFLFKGNIKEPTIAFLIGNVKSRAVLDPNFTSFFLEDTIIKISLSVNQFKEADIYGSFTENELNELERDDACKNMLQLNLKLLNNSVGLKQDPENKLLLERRDSIIKAFDPYSQKIEKLERSFITTHSHSFVSAYKLQYLLSRLPVDTVRKYYNGLDISVQNSRSGNLIADLLGGQPGHKAAQFGAIDVNGDSLNLASFKNKQYILLDFWASWCVPCRENNPKLITLYKMYHPRGLEIIAIANDDQRKEAWKKAISADGVGIWRNILQNAGAENDLARKFGVTPIPLKLLIDKEGMIIGRYDPGDDNSLVNDLKKIFR